MVKFSFEMSDEDAENLITILHDHVRNIEYESLTGTLPRPTYNEAEREWLAKHAKYLDKNILQAVLSGQSKEGDVP